MILKLAIDCFALSPDVAQAFEALAGDPSLSRAKIAVLPGGLAAAPAHYADQPTPQLVIVEDDATDPGGASLLERLEHLAEVCEANTRVLVVGSANDIVLYRALMARGVSDYLLRPVAPRQLVDAISGLFADPQAAPRGKVVAVMGARGGAGASTIAQNLAWSLARGGDQVVYVDLDLAYGSSLVAFNLEAKQTVAEPLANPARLDAVMIERCMIAYDERLNVLVSPGDMRLAADHDVEAVDTVVDLASRASSVTVLDLPHLWLPWVEHVLAGADEVVLVATPDLVSLRDAKSLGALVQHKGKGGTPPRLVLNRVEAGKRSQVQAKDFAENAGMEPVASLPLDTALFASALNSGRMVGEVAKTHKVAKQFAELAAAISPRQVTGARKGAQPGSPLAPLLAWLKG